MHLAGGRLIDQTVRGAITRIAAVMPSEMTNDGTTQARTKKIIEKTGRPGQKRRAQFASGCHAHGFAWACERGRVYRGRGNGH